MSEAGGNSKDPHPTPPEPQIDGSASPTLDADATLDSSQSGALPAATRTTGPRSIGLYRLVKKLGEGGMGQVWLAEQTAPLRRQVALKLIRAGMYDDALLQRFQSERQSLAIMDHPAIAKVFDAGATPDGQPYFVMEYVPGATITDYCDQKRLKIHERLELFIKVCEGVQHAHQKAIIHRDLKPANILVVEVDSKPMPRIIDFGLAKAVTPQVAGATVFTQVGGFLGTPGYMSPEQASPDIDIDTRIDVYSLGVVLYVLLTGSLPFDPKQWQKQPLHEVLRQLREDDPPRPSTKLVMEKKSSTAIAEARGVGPKQLVSLLHGDLDWITMKALDRDRARRYGTPNELAEDIGRHLNSQLVVACPASTGYRLQKYIRRHRVGVAVAAGAVLLLAGFAVVQGVQLRRITRERDRANRVTDFMTGMFNLSDPSEARGNTITAREILDKAAKDIDTGLARDPELQAQMMHVMGTVYQSLGLYPQEQSLLERAIGIRRRVLGAKHADTLMSMNALGNALAHEGHFAEAEKLERETLESQSRVLGPEHPNRLLTMNNLAYVLSDEGRYAEAERLYRETLDIRRRVLGLEHPDTLRSMMNLAANLRDEGHYAEAEKLERETLEIQNRVLGPEHPNTLATMNNLGNVLILQSHDSSEAEKLFRQTLEIQRRVLGPEHPLTLTTMNNLGNALMSQGHDSEAEKLFRQTLEIQRRVLGPEHPDTAISTYNLAVIAAHESHRDEAFLLLREAINHGLPPGADLGVDKDPDLKLLHDDPRFDVLVAYARQRAAAAQKPN
jgi:serine/threonine protein kinase/tetratricopeptide (TPR) repeat protein